MEKSKFWTLENLYTAISKDTIERLHGKIRMSDRNHAYKKICFCCDKAKNIVMDILSNIYTEDSFPEKVPEIIKECIVVLAAIYLSTESDKDDYKESLRQRYKIAEKLLMALRDSHIIPNINNNENDPALLGDGNQEL